MKIKNVVFLVLAVISFGQIAGAMNTQDTSQRDELLHLNADLRDGWKKDLFEALAITRNVEEAKHLILSEDINVNIRLLDDGRSLLHVAAEFGHPQIVKMLLDAPEIDINVTVEDRQSFYNNTTPFFSTMFGLKNLIETGTLQRCWGQARWDALFLIAKMLLQSPNLDINKRFGHNMSVLDMLVNVGVECGYSNNHPRISELSRESKQAFYDLLKALLRHPKINTETAYNMAIRGGCEDIAEIIITEPLKKNEWHGDRKDRSKFMLDNCEFNTILIQDGTDSGKTLKASGLFWFRS